MFIFVLQNAKLAKILLTNSFFAFISTCIENLFFPEKPILGRHYHTHLNLNMETYVRSFLLAYLVVTISFTFILPVYRLYQRTRIDAITFKGSNSLHDCIGKLLVLCYFVFVIVGCLFASDSPFYAFCMPFYSLEKSGLQYLGAILGVISLVLTIVAQTQMHTSWRMGIDEDHFTPLITTGIFRYTRNPIFIGMLLSLLSFFLLMPNMILLLIFVLSFFMVITQVHLEETFLEKQHGEVYRNYCRMVARWV
jgi:protein-S-isoprenylcysteine O-methyltransferase Ste14